MSNNAFEYLNFRELMYANTNIPETLVGRKAATLNGTGYVFYEMSPLANKFITKEALFNKNILEIGAGFGNVAIRVLEKGVGSYTANDISKEHLTLLVSRIKNTFRNRADEKLKYLKLLLAKAPQGLPTNELYDAVLMDKVLHFFEPEEIEYFIMWAKKAIKKNGKLYILTVSPHNKVFRDKVLSVYLERSFKGGRYPGFIKNVQECINRGQIENHPNFYLPKNMVFFSKSDLKSLFEGHGFKIIQTFSLVVPEEDGAWRYVPDNKSGVVGIIAMNV